MWYTITSTDKSQWLSSLAAQYLGDWSLYNLIYEANKDVMQWGADVIQPGMKLWIPINGEPKPVAASAPPGEMNVIDVTPTSSASSPILSGFSFDNKLIMIGLGLAVAAAVILMKQKPRTATA